MIEVLIRHRNLLLGAYLLGALFFLVAIESVFNGGFFFAISWLWLPLLVIVFGFTWWYRERLYRLAKNSKVRMWVIAALMYPLVLLMSWPYMMALNAATATGARVVYKGPIVRKWVSKGKSTSYHIDIYDEATRMPVTLNCSSQRYDSLSEGQVISREFQLGGFGIPFGWRFSRG